MNFGLPEILVVLFIVLLLFGGRRLPELARGLGKALSEFRKGVKDVSEEAEPLPKIDEKKSE
jgi:sec-independent protein translocase protein TatA